MLLPFNHIICLLFSAGTAATRLHAKSKDRGCLWTVCLWFYSTFHWSLWLPTTTANNPNNPNNNQPNRHLARLVPKHNHNSRQVALSAVLQALSVVLQNQPLVHLEVN